MTDGRISPLPEVTRRSLAPGLIRLVHLGLHCWPQLLLLNELLATCFTGLPIPFVHRPLGPALLQ